MRVCTLYICSNFIYIKTGNIPLWSLELYFFFFFAAKVTLTIYVVKNSILPKEKSALCPIAPRKQCLIPRMSCLDKIVFVSLGLATSDSLIMWFKIGPLSHVESARPIKGLETEVSQVSRKSDICDWAPIKTLTMKAQMSFPVGNILFVLPHIVIR